MAEVSYPPPPAQPSTGDPARRRKVVILTVGGVVVLALLAVFFSSELFTRTFVSRVRVAPSKIEPGTVVTLRWSASKANRARYPFERISLCEAKRRGARCAVIAAATPNDGAESFRVPNVPPGAYRLVLQALDAGRRPVAKVAVRSNAVRVLPAEGGGDGGGDGGGGGGGDGGGGGPPPPPPPPPPPYGHGGVPPPPPSPHG